MSPPITATLRYLITLGDKSYPPSRLYASAWISMRHNRAYLCGLCGAVWARFTLEDASDPTGLSTEWHTARHTCPEHQFGTWDRDVPGSLIDNNEDILILPRELLLRELFLTTAAPVADETDTPLTQE